MILEFRQIHVDAIQRVLNESAQPATVKRTRLCPNMVVIGRPGVSGSLAVWLADWSLVQPGRTAWKMTWAPTLDPKSLADNGVGDDHQEGCRTTEAFYWADMVKAVKQKFCS